MQDNDQDRAIGADDLALLGDTPADTSADTSASDAATSDKSSGASDKGGTSAKDSSAKDDSASDDGKSGGAFPDNWRDLYVQGLPDEQKGKAKDWLAKRSSPHEVLRAGLAADAKIQELSQGRVKVPTGKGDDPKDIAAFRKAIGVPEKVEDYKIDLPKEYGAELQANDKELLDEFLKDAHEKNMTQAQVDHSIKTYWAVQQRVNAMRAAEAMRVDQAAEDEIRTEMGKEFRGNVELINRMLSDGLSKHGWDAPEDRRDFLSQRLENGVKLGSWPPFVRWLSEMARERADDGTLEFGDGGDAVDVDRRIDDIMKIRDKDMKEYQRLEPELKKLIAVQNRRKTRGG